MQLFNFLNARKLRDEYNIFAGLFKGYLFIGILFLIAGLQASANRRSQRGGGTEEAARCSRSQCRLGGMLVVNCSSC